MADIINLNDYRQLKQTEDVIEQQYQQLVSKLNKLIGIPKNEMEMSQSLYFILRYLDGTLNGLAILSSFGMIDYDMKEQIKEQATNYLNAILDDLSKI